MPASKTQIIKTEQAAVTIWLLTLILQRMYSATFAPIEKPLCLILCFFFYSEILDKLQDLKILQKHISKFSSLLVACSFYYVDSMPKSGNAVDNRWVYGIFNLGNVILPLVLLGMITTLIFPKVFSLCEAIILVRFLTLIGSWVNSVWSQFQPGFGLVLDTILLCFRPENLALLAIWASSSGLTFYLVTKLKNLKKTEKRKIFHLNITFVYLVVLVFNKNSEPELADSRNLFLLLVSVVLLGLLLVCQIANYLLTGKNKSKWSQNLRYTKLQKFYVSNIYNFFDQFADEKDKISGHLVLITSISLLCVFISSQVYSLQFLNFVSQQNLSPLQSKIMPLVGILSIGIGDTAAAYFGTKFGKLKITSYSKKSFNGWFYSCLCQILFLYFYLWYDVGEVLARSYTISCLIPIIISSFVEALTFQIDNFIVPVCLFQLL